MDTIVIYSPAPGPASGITIVGYSHFGSGGTRICDLTSLDAVGSANGTGDGGTISEGDLVLVFQNFATTTNRTMGMVTAGYTQEANLYVAGTYATEVGLFWKVMGATPDTTAEVSYVGSSTDNQRGACVVLRGVDGTTRFDVATVTSSASGTNPNDPNPGSITPVTAGALILVFGAGTDDPTSNFTMSVGANVTFIDNHNGGASAADGACALGLKNWTSGAFDPDAFTASTNISGSATAASIVCALRPA